MGKFVLKKDNKEVEIDVNLDTYIDLAGRTNNPDYDAVSERMKNSECFLGTAVLLQRLVRDLDVNLDSVKKHLFYGKALKEGALSQPISVPGDTPNHLDLSKFLNNPKMIDIFHGVIGQATEAGEMIKALLQFMETGNIDLVNLAEESGDQNWYNALIMKQAGVTFDKVLTTNIHKLALRFPDGFTEDKAINRDTDAERVLLESKLTEF